MNNYARAVALGVPEEISEAQKNLDLIVIAQFDTFEVSYPVVVNPDKSVKIAARTENVMIGTYHGVTTSQLVNTSGKALTGKQKQHAGTWQRWLLTRFFNFPYQFLLDPDNSMLRSVTGLNVFPDKICMVTDTNMSSFFPGPSGKTFKACPLGTDGDFVDSLRENETNKEEIMFRIGKLFQNNGKQSLVAGYEDYQNLINFLVFLIDEFSSICQVADGACKEACEQFLRRWRSFLDLFNNGYHMTPQYLMFDHTESQEHLDHDWRIEDDVNVDPADVDPELLSSIAQSSLDATFTKPRMIEYALLILDKRSGSIHATLGRLLKAFPDIGYPFNITDPDMPKSTGSSSSLFQYEYLQPIAGNYVMCGVWEKRCSPKLYADSHAASVRMNMVEKPEFIYFPSVKNGNSDKFPYSSISKNALNLK